jgi:hypothetical protein
MAETITVRWAGPSDATSGSAYRVERSLDMATWSELAAAQAATSPYVSVTGTLNGAATYGSTTIVMNANSLSSSGYGWLDDALIQWTGKSGDNLTGVTWHSGYGSYASGSTIHQAHESYTDSTTPTDAAVVYRITHIDSASRESPPTYCWYYYPDAPASRDHCVVLATIGADLGVDAQAGVSVRCYLSTDDQFASIGGSHLDADVLPANTATTNDLGIAQFQCWKSSARAAKGGGAASSYTFVLNTANGPLTVTAATIPDRDWVLLKDIAA